MAAKKPAETTAETTNTAETAIVVITKPTSDKLLALEQEQDAILEKMPTFAPRSDEQKQAFKRLNQLDSEITAEIAAINNLITAEKNAEYRAAQLAVIEQLIIAAIAEHDHIAIYNATEKTADDIATMNEFTTARKNAFEIIANKIIGSPKRVATGLNGSKTSNSDVLKVHLENIANGLNETQSKNAIIAAGVPVSTVWHQINNHKKAVVAKLRTDGVNDVNAIVAQTGFDVAFVAKQF